MSRRRGFNRNDGYDVLPNSDETVKMYSRVSPSNTAFNWLVAATVLVGAVAITALLIGSTGYYGLGSNPTFDSINVKGVVNSSEVNTGEISSESIGFGSVDVENLTTTDHTSQTITSDHVNATTVSSNLVDANQVTSPTVMTDRIMYNILEVVENGELSDSHTTYHLSNASIAINVTLPSDLTPMIGKRIKICNADGKKHIIDASPNFMDSSS